MQLTVNISSASDGYFLLKAKELPGLLAKAARTNEIPDAVCKAAAALTGCSPHEFDVIADY